MKMEWDWNEKWNENGMKMTWKWNENRNKMKIKWNENIMTIKWKWNGIKIVRKFYDHLVLGFLPFLSNLTSFKV